MLNYTESSLRTQYESAKSGFLTKLASISEKELPYGPRAKPRKPPATDLLMGP